jgi:hypothetical protein
MMIPARLSGFTLLIALAFLALLAGTLIPACESDDDDDDDDDDSTVDGAGDDDDDNLEPPCETDIYEVCDYLFVNCEQNGGWPDVNDCYELHNTGCADDDGYFGCVCSCLTLEGGCEAFEPCEYTCWNDNCDGTF